MVLGQTIGTEVELLSGASYDIKPTQSSDEWIVHNIYVTDGKSIKVEKTNGTVFVHVYTDSTSVSGVFHVTYTHYIHITNMAGETIYIGYDGIASA